MLVRAQQQSAAGSLTSSADVTSRFKNKFEQGWLGGVGSVSQFQGANSRLPVAPARTNDDTVSRIISSQGLASGERLLPSWQRSYAFAPGLGIDAARSGVTWTDSNAGRDATTNVIAPVTNAGVNFVGDQPAPAFVSYQIGSANTQAPVALTGGEAAETKVGIIKSWAAAANRAEAKRTEALSRYGVRGKPPPARGGAK